ncbi:hypothetical protein Glove_71g122 [Diversispora epigaea]|uniref:Uncharacterized protein n=1 Tax=Diversispora epigaea TaxID=1348612 RepID=A0A397J9R8_9GLOM|nr:hypothetical protein Glove_71g122 [Diversispora epigaea]
MQFCQVKLQMLTDTTTTTTTKTIVSVTSTSDDNNIDNNDLIQNNKSAMEIIEATDHILWVWVIICLKSSLMM